MPEKFFLTISEISFEQFIVNEGSDLKNLKKSDKDNLLSEITFKNS